MNKKVLVISTSLRNNSNSEKLAQAFIEGAKEGGNDVEFVSLKGKQISFCTGCFACQKLGRCVIKDDANEITEKILNCDVVVWVTPIYYYEMSGSMKTMIDRANSLYPRDYKFRDVYLLCCATDTEDFTPDGAIKGVEGWVACFEKSRFAGSLFVGGVTMPKEIDEKIEELKKAFEMGLSV